MEQVGSKVQNWPTCAGPTSSISLSTSVCGVFSFFPTDDIELRMVEEFISLAVLARSFFAARWCQIYQISYDFARFLPVKVVGHDDFPYSSKIIY